MNGSTMDPRVALGSRDWALPNVSFRRQHLDELLAAIRERLEHGRNLELWKGSVATIDFGARIVLPDALDSIIGVLKDG